MENQKLELRMYGLVPYNISPIQQAIQFGHAVVEYGQDMKRLGEHNQSLNIQYNDWADNWKTFMILNGGTSNHSKNRYQVGVELWKEFSGTMEGHRNTLVQNGITFANFYEPDLNDMLSSIVFLVDERVFDKEKYPDFEDWVLLNHSEILTSDPNTDDYRRIGKSQYQIAKMIKDSPNPQDIKVYQEWVNHIGGEKNLFLRIFLKNFRLA